MNKTITVETGGERIDKYLVDHIELSRSQIAKRIQAGEITVGGKTVTKHLALEVGDVIDVAIPEEEAIELVPVDIPVIYEDDSVLVVSKPVGVLVHPTSSSREWTLAHFIQAHVPEITEVGDSPERPGMVHRLDRGVSGVMVIAKTQDAFEHLKAQFKARTVGKEYRAIVLGVPNDSYGIIKFKIDHSKRKGGKMAARPEHEDGKTAWTEYDVLQTINERYAELSVRIKTGRTHQIRAHLAAIDHPVVGDQLYASKHYKTGKEYPRIFLHSYTLSFIHPETGEDVEYQSALPEEFTTFTENT
jgi:23S rRNA pseudouridine1911/1915/1917 synthase